MDAKKIAKKKEVIKIKISLKNVLSGFEQKIWSSRTVFSVDNNKKRFWAPNEHIRLISKRSCDTKNLIQNDSENSA